MITLNKNILFPTLWILSLFVYLSSLFFNANNAVLSSITFLYLITVPGFLIMLSMKLKDLGFWNCLILSVGLSLFFLMIPGVLFNWIWPLFSELPPLQKGVLTIFYSVLIFILMIIASVRNKELSVGISTSISFYLKRCYFLIPPFLTLLSIFSAIVLNNGGSNILAITTMSSIAISMLLAIIAKAKIDEHFFPFSLYFHSLSLLLMLSLRSNYVSGWDIQSEFVLFQLTKNLGFWSPFNMNDAYNACLSISLLPSIFARLTNFPDDYIYKLFYQILFAITPVTIYQLYRRYFVAVTGYIAVIYIISQPLFIQPMTALMRQEIAFIFFALMIWILFENRLTTMMRSTLFLLFGMGMVVSHYSTTYITLLLIIGVYPLISMLRLLEKISFISSIFNALKISTAGIKYTYYLNPVIVFLLVGFAFLWYGPINNQLGQVQQVATEGLSRMNELFQSEITSGESKQALPFSERSMTSIGAIQSYIDSQLPLVGGDARRLYPPESYQQMNVHPVSPISVTPIMFSRMNTNILTLLDILKQVLKICIMLGPLYLIIWYFRKNEIPREYIIFSIIAVLVIVVMTFHPYFGLQYNLSRFYLQLLFFLSLPAVILMLFIFYPFKQFASLINGFLFCVLFIYLSGIAYHVFGGEARMYLNNFGADYDKFYVHKEELASAEWMKKYVNKGETLFMDREANLRIYRVMSRGFNYNVLPALIYQDAYVYGSYANIVSNRTGIYITGSTLEFSFPRQFLEENKDVIYSNGASRIYR